MIIEGLLWFDDSERATADKIERAAQRYQQKYGHAPEVCYVHHDQGEGKTSQQGMIRVVPIQSVLPHHFWLGVENKRPKEKKASTK